MKIFSEFRVSLGFGYALGEIRFSKKAYLYIKFVMFFSGTGTVTRVFLRSFPSHALFPIRR